MDSPTELQKTPSQAIDKPAELQKIPGQGVDKPAEPQKTLGQVIDEVIRALSSLNAQGRLTAVRAACEHLKIQPPEGSGAKPPGYSLSEPGQVPAPAVAGPADIRSLKERKQPSSAIEMAALVAYYLSEIAPQSERKQEVDQDDMEKYFKQANFPLPKMQFLLVNAKNAGYLDSAGGGKYRLNAVGYNLVAHNLPRGQTTLAPVARKKSHRSPGKRKKQRTSQ